jgi:predicted DNA binding protein
MIRLEPLDERDYARIVEWIDSPELLTQWGGTRFSHPLTEDQLREHFDADPAVADHQRITELPDRRLYRVVLSEEASRRVIHPVVIEHDIPLMSLPMTAETVRILARFPTHESLAAFRSVCRERDIPFELKQFYEEESAVNDGGVGSRYGVTDAQHEALLHALEAGYFSVPREATLETVAEALDVSPSALSTRLRRGQQNLLGNTLGLEADE